MTARIRSSNESGIINCSDCHASFQVYKQIHNLHRGGSQGGGLKKIAPSGGRREIFGIFRVKNHDFMQKNHIFSNCGGRRKFCLGYFIHHRLVKSYKNHSTVCSLTDLYLVASITSLKFSSTFSDTAIVLSMFISTFVFCDSV